jgi:hypothetical protein
MATVPSDDEDRRGPSTPTLLRLSASAAVMNAVVPLALAVQVSLIGMGKGSGELPILVPSHFVCQKHGARDSPIIERLHCTCNDVPAGR